MQEEIRLQVGVAVVRTLDAGAISEQRVTFVEQQDDVQFLGTGEDLVQVLLGFPDVFVDDGGEIQAIQIHSQRRCEQTRRHGFAGSAGTAEQRADSAVEASAE